MKQNKKIEKKIKKISKSLAKIKEIQLKGIRIKGADLLKKYLDKEESEIIKEINLKQTEGLKLELKEAITLSKELTKQNKRLLFWKKFPFWATFLLIIIIFILLNTREIIFKSSLFDEFEKSQLFILFSIISLFIMICIVLFIIVKYIRKSGEDINTETRLGHDQIKDSIETYLKPSVNIQVGLDSVIKEATQILEETINTKNPFLFMVMAH